MYTYVPFLLDLPPSPPSHPLGHHRALHWAPRVTRPLLATLHTCSEYVGATLSVCLNLHDNTIRFYCAHKVHVNWRKVTRQQQPSLFWRLYKGLWAKFPEQWSGSCGPLGTVWKSQGACEVGCSWAFPELKAVPVFLRSGLVSRQHCGPSIFILLQWKALERKKKKRHMVPIVW